MIPTSVFDSPSASAGCRKLACAWLAGEPNRNPCAPRSLTGSEPGPTATTTRMSLNCEPWAVPTPEPAGRLTANWLTWFGAGCTGGETCFVVQQRPLPELTIANRSGAGASPLRTRTRVTAPDPRGT